MLAAFALATVVTIGVLAHSFLSAFAPPKEIVKSQPPLTVVKTRASTQVMWDSAQQNRSTRYPNYIPPTSPGERRAPTAGVALADWGGMVHMQSEDLRKKVAASDEPAAAKQRTLERIDEMVQKGLLIQ